MPLKQLREQLQQLADNKKSRVFKNFFKTGPGGYSEGEIFLGIPVPSLRKLAKIQPGFDSKSLVLLLSSKIHEEKMLGTLILVEAYQTGGENQKTKVFSFYLKYLSKFNNWDLVDLSAPRILGAHLAQTDRCLLTRLARADNFWIRRIAIVATHHFIKQGDFSDTFRIAQMLLHDPEDLIHKAVGWMLREVGKKNQKVEEEFLEKHAPVMPRTMLRYAIERFTEKKRRYFLRLS